MHCLCPPQKTHKFLDTAQAAHFLGYSKSTPSSGGAAKAQALSTTRRAAAFATSNPILMPTSKRDACQRGQRDRDG